MSCMYYNWKAVTKILAAIQDGRLKSGDRLLQIGEVDVRDLTTEEVATILRQSGAHVILIVTRSVDSMPDISDTRAAVIPIDQLDDYLLSINQVTDFSRLSSEADLNVSHQSLPVSNYSSSSLTLNVSRTALHRRRLALPCCCCPYLEQFAATCYIHTFCVCFPRLPQGSPLWAFLPMTFTATFFSASAMTLSFFGHLNRFFSNFFADYAKNTAVKLWICDALSVCWLGSVSFKVLWCFILCCVLTF